MTTGEKKRTSSWRADRGGHAPGYLRDAFLEWLELYLGGENPATVQVGDDETDRPVSWLLGQLWNCADIMPGTVWSELADHLELEAPYGGATYARAVRLLKPVLAENA
jgi:hypothetical protein